MSDFNKTQKILFEQLQKHATEYIESEQRGIVVDDLDVDGFIEECSKLVQANGDNTSDSGLHLQRVSQRSEQLAIAALDKIAHPIKYLQEEAEKEGAKLDGGMAIQITQDANFYQDIADKALKAIANCG